MKQNILIFSTSRADYGILENLCISLSKNKKVKFFLGLTGTHFSKKYGNTSENISKKINKKNILQIKNINFTSDNSEVVAKNILNIQKHVLIFLKKRNIDKLIVLGDRYELLGICIPFFFKKIPIYHLHGGEETKGSYDNEIRKVISLISKVHFTVNDFYKNNLINFLNIKKNIYNFGSLAAEDIKKSKSFYTKKVIEKKFKVKFSDRNIIISLHPETNNLNNHKKNIDNFFQFLKNVKKTNIFFTSPGHDTGSIYIIQKIKKLIQSNNNFYYVNSFGKKYYFSMLKICDCLIGNSSSGILEAPSFKIPVLNIGNRQLGRIQSKNIINSSYMVKDLNKKINIALSIKFKKSLKNLKFEYYKKNTLNNIQKIIMKDLYE